MSKPKKSKVTRLPDRRYVRTPGAPIREEDAVIIGRAFEELAAKNGCDGIHSVTDAEMAEEVIRDANHPMRHLYDWDIDSAAKKHWIEHTRKLRLSVNVVTVSLEGRERRDPLFYFATAPVQIEAGKTHKRRQVLRSDALKHDPQFISAIGFKIRMLINVLESLEKITSSRGDTPEDITMMVLGIRETINNYMRTIRGAAE